MAARSLEELKERRVELERQFGETITIDGLTGEYLLFQRRKGYRYSTDDLLTAWFAISRASAPVTHYLDLGIGIGCVGLAVAWRFAHAAVVGVETQAIAVSLLKENVWANQLEERVQVIEADLREAQLPSRQFDLITASPPYFPPGSGLLPADSQLAHCRFELNGDITDYARVAAAALAPAGRFVFCFPSTGRSRVESALAAAGLQLAAVCHVLPRAGVAPLFSLFDCGLSPTLLHESSITVRDERGQRTPEMSAARLLLGFTP